MHYAADEYEQRTQTRWCRRCGCLLWSKRYGNRSASRVKPCRVVRVTFRAAHLRAALAVSDRHDEGGGK
jgi:hypothetical protein